jgi:hypothetical protein
MTSPELRSILQDVQCDLPGVRWVIHLSEMGEGFYVQLRYVERDVDTGELEEQHGRKWYVSTHATRSEVVQTVLKACLTSAEHMVREHFTYRGVRVFGPHLDIDQLAELVSHNALQRAVREP